MWVTLFQLLPLHPLVSFDRTISGMVAGCVLEQWDRGAYFSPLQWLPGEWRAEQLVGMPELILRQDNLPRVEPLHINKCQERGGDGQLPD